LDQAMELFAAEPGNLSSDAAMQLAQACFAAGKKDQGSELIKHVVRNNHEDEAVLSEARQMFDDLGMADEGNAIISGTCQEVIALNNDGVDLAKQGKLQESIKLFVKAARAMPENLIINLNTAQSIIMLMQSQGANDRNLDQAKTYLDRVRTVNSANERLTKLMARYNDLARSVN
ncbi:tetratricopeptide repeat protein, partial [Kaarinaea lacus]